MELINLKNFVKNLNFKVLVILLVVVIVVSQIIRLALSSTSRPGTPLSDAAGISQDTSYVAIEPTQVAGGGVENRKLIVVYVEDLDVLTSAEIKRLISIAAKTEGLVEGEYRVVIEEYEDDVPLKVDDAYLLDPGAIDYTDPLTYAEYGNTALNHYADPNVIYEGFTSVTFAEYVGEGSIADEYYEIYPRGNNTFLVVLKLGYTQTLFEKEVLASFTNSGNPQIVYESRDQFWLEE